MSPQPISISVRPSPETNDHEVLPRSFEWVDSEQEDREGDWHRRLPEALRFVLALRARPSVGAGHMPLAEALGGAVA